MTSRIDVTVAAVIERNDRYLIVEEQVRGKRVLNQPAGHLESGESLPEAVIREVYEETGYQFEPHALVGIFQWQTEDCSFVRVTYSGLAKPPKTTPKLDEGIIQTHWMSRDRLQQKETQLRSPMVLACIDRYREGNPLPLDAVISLVSEISGITQIA